MTTPRIEEMVDDIMHHAESFVADYSNKEWFRARVTSFIKESNQAGIDEAGKKAREQMEAGYHLTKYITEPSLVQKGMIAAYCCCHDAFMIETDEELTDVVENLEDEEEELKYTVVRIQDAYLLCGDFDNVSEKIRCPRVRALQDNK